MLTFIEELEQLLEKVKTGTIDPIEFTVSNDTSKTKGKVTQNITFSFDIDEPEDKTPS